MDETDLSKRERSVFLRRKVFLLDVHLGKNILLCSASVRLNGRTTILRTLPERQLWPGSGSEYPRVDGDIARERVPQREAPRRAIDASAVIIFLMWQCLW